MQTGLRQQTSPKEASSNSKSEAVTALSPLRSPGHVLDGGNNSSKLSEIPSPSESALSGSVPNKSISTPSVSPSPSVSCTEGSVPQLISMKSMRPSASLSSHMSPVPLPLKSPWSGLGTSMQLSSASSTPSSSVSRAWAPTIIKSTTIGRWSEEAHVSPDSSPYWFRRSEDMSLV